MPKLADAGPQHPLRMDLRPTTGKDDAAQIECINNAYADNADVILLASNGPDTQVATIEQLTMPTA